MVELCFNKPSRLKTRTRTAEHKIFDLRSQNSVLIIESSDIYWNAWFPPLRTFHRKLNWIRQTCLAVDPNPPTYQTKRIAAPNRKPNQTLKRNKPISKTISLTAANHQLQPIINRTKPAKDLIVDRAKPSYEPHETLNRTNLSTITKTAYRHRPTSIYTYEVVSCCLCIFWWIFLTISYINPLIKTNCFLCFFLSLL